jgi:hypothetical protein
VNQQLKLKQLHQDQQCALCGAHPADQADEEMGAVEPAPGWAGEPVPTCDMCANGEASWENAVALGKARFWVGPKMRRAFTESEFDWWCEDDAVAIPRGEGDTWWHGAEYGVVLDSGRTGEGREWVRVRLNEGEENERVAEYAPGALIEKTNPYEEEH